MNQGLQVEALWGSILVIAGRRDCESKSDDLGQGTSLGIQWLRLYAPNAGGLGLITVQGTRSHMPQLEILSAAAKTCCLVAKWCPTLLRPYGL